MNAAAYKPDTRRRILVVEDESPISEIISDGLSSANFEPECVHTDSAARERLRRERYAAIILDINLGQGETGFDIARFARMQRPDIAVMYVSGQASERSFKAFGVPNSHFVPKPFSIAELVTRLEGLLGANDA